MANSLLKYHMVRDQIGIGDAISWRGDYLISKIIGWFSRSGDMVRNHISCVTQQPVCMAERKLIIEADEGEVNPRLLSRKLKDYRGRAYWHKLRPQFDPYREGIGAFLWNQVGVGYDYFSLPTQLFMKISINAEKFFCSELYGAALMDVIPDWVWKQAFLQNNQYVQDLLRGKALKPIGVALLPVFEEEIQIL